MGWPVHFVTPLTSESHCGTNVNRTTGRPRCEVDNFSADLPLLHLGPSLSSALPPFADAHRRHPIRPLLAGCCPSPARYRPAAYAAFRPFDCSDPSCLHPADTQIPVTGVWRVASNVKRLTGHPSDYLRRHLEFSFRFRIHAQR